MKKHRINEIMKNIIISILFYVSMRRANLALGADPIGPDVILHAPTRNSRNNTCDRLR